MIQPPFAPGDRKVPWLDCCAKDWTFKPIKYQCGINRRALKEDTDPDFEFRYVDIGSVNSDGQWGASEPMRFESSPSRARRIVSSGDVLISTVRTYLRAITHISKVEEPLICSTGFAVVSADGCVDSKFLAYWARSISFVDEIVARSLGVSYPAVNASDIGNLPIPVLEKTRQRAIAAFLDRETARIDALIEKKQRQIELLQEKRAALISHVVTKGLDPNSPMKDSRIDWLGHIPAHWEVVPLKYSLLPRAGAIKTGPFGSQLLSSDMAGGDVKVYNQRNVLDRDFSSGENYISKDKYQELRTFTVFPQDVLITTRGTIGHCSLLPDHAEKGILHPCLMRIQLNPLKASPEYAALLIQDSGIVLLQLQLLSNATTIEVIYSESLKSVRLPLPPVPEQQAILAYVRGEADQHDLLIEKVHDSIDRLREFRNALISAAVTGKIDVRKEAVR